MLPNSSNKMAGRELLGETKVERGGKKFIVRKYKGVNKKVKHVSFNDYDRKKADLEKISLKDTRLNHKPLCIKLSNMRKLNKQNKINKSISDVLIVDNSN